MRILLVEDEVHISEALVQIFKKNNYTIDAVYNGEDGLDYGLTGIYDVIVLDIMLPLMDGISVLRQLRKEKVKTPVLMLTAKGEIADRVKGLDCGADDYLIKPFSTEELLARVRAMGRRNTDIITDEDGNLNFGDLELNIQNLKISCGSKEVKLTLKECELMEFLIMRDKHTSPKELIIEKLWGYDSEVEHNHVEVYISFLRKKLKHLNSAVTIETLRGVGYILEDKNV